MGNNSRTCARFSVLLGTTVDISGTSYVAIPWESAFMDNIYSLESTPELDTQTRIKVKDSGKYLIMGCINYEGSTSNYRFTTRVGFSINEEPVYLSLSFLGSYIRAADGSNYSGAYFGTILDLDAGWYFEVKSKRISTRSGNAALDSGTNLSITKLI